MPTDAALPPLIILPGVALLVLSASARMAQLHQEVLRVADSPSQGERALAGRMLVLRGRHFRDALRLFYLAVGLLCAGGVLGGLVGVGVDVPVPMTALTCLALLAVVVAAAFLLAESSRSLRSLEVHVEAVCVELPSPSDG